MEIFHHWCVRRGSRIHPGSLFNGLRKSSSKDKTFINVKVTVYFKNELSFASWRTPVSVQLHSWKIGSRYVQSRTSQRRLQCQNEIRTAATTRISRAQNWYLPRDKPSPVSADILKQNTLTQRDCQLAKMHPSEWERKWLTMCPFEFESNLKIRVIDSTALMHSSITSCTNVLVCREFKFILRWKISEIFLSFKS
jgi:hypothetical protein